MSSPSRTAAKAAPTSPRSAKLRSNSASTASKPRATAPAVIAGRRCCDTARAWRPAEEMRWRQDKAICHPYRGGKPPGQNGGKVMVGKSVRATFGSTTRLRGVSSVGRAPALQAGGRRFEPGTLHSPPEVRSGCAGASRLRPASLLSETSRAGRVNRATLLRSRDEALLTPLGVRTPTVR